MNIFYLHTDPRIAAEYHCDKHVVKMILESAQLLCTAHRLLDGIEGIEHRLLPVKKEVEPKIVGYGEGTTFLNRKPIFEETQVLTEAEPPPRWRKLKRWTLLDDREQILYTAGHVNHPSAVWVRQNIDHYRWLYDLMYHLIGEYKYRYEGKYHKCEEMLIPLLNAPYSIPIIDWQQPPQAMPDDSKVPGDSVAAYRNYYMIHKRRMANWKIRGTPDWYK